MTKGVKQPATEGVKLVKRIYGFNWAAVGSRKRGFQKLAEVVSPDFQSRMSEEVGGREVGVVGLEHFVESIEQDFSEFNYEPDEIVAAPDGKTVVVVGRIQCKGRSSGMPLTHEFGHVWTVADGKATRVEGHLSRDDALEAAGINA